jgi:hypothetical protein
MRDNVKASEDCSVTGHKQQQDVSGSAQWACAWPVGFGAFFCDPSPFVFSDGFA